MTTAELPPKKDVMLALLERSSVFIHLDPRHESVRVPPWFKKQAQLVLQVGLNMAVRIPDLDVGDDAVSCTLSFSRSPFFCYMPWSAVFALVADDGKGMLWPNDIPPEVAAQQAERAKKEQARARMRPVEDAEAAPASAKPEEAEKGAPPVAEKGAAPKSNGKKARAKARAEKPPVASLDSSKVRPRGPEHAAPGPNRPSEPHVQGGAGGAAARPEAKRPLPPYLRVVK